MSKLLINEPPLQVLPSLAVLIGLNEAIALQQLHYWLSPDRKPKVIDGMPWVYNSASSWHKQFPFWSMPTIWRIFDNLEENGLIKSGNFNRSRFDRTKWYTINYSALEDLELLHFTPVNNGSYQDEPTIPETKKENINLPAEPAGDISTPPPCTTKNITDAYQGVVPYPVDWSAGEGRAAKWLAKAGYSGQQVADCYRHLKAQPFWKDKPLSLASLKKQIGEYVKLHPSAATAAGGVDYNKFGYTPSGKLVELK